MVRCLPVRVIELDMKEYTQEKSHSSVSTVVRSLPGTVIELYMREYTQVRNHTSVSIVIKGSQGTMPPSIVSKVKKLDKRFDS